MKKKKHLFRNLLVGAICISMICTWSLQIDATEMMDTDDAEVVIVDDDTTKDNLVTVDDADIYGCEDNNANYSSENIHLATGVTEEMCNSSYWSEKTINSSATLMSKKEIMELNANTINTKDANMYDLENIETKYNGNKLKNILANQELPQKDLYINKEIITDKEEYFEKLKNKILGSNTTDSDSIKYAVAVKWANMKSWPTLDMVGYSENDPDDELQLSALCVNEPFVIKGVTADGKFYYGMSDNCMGWVPADCLAICSSKEEWVDSWKVDIDKKDFLVVMTNKILLENSATDTVSANVLLTLGTTLKLVPQSKIPSNFMERGDWNNYVVYLPTRDDEGRYVKKYALISMHYYVSVGYNELSQENIMKVAFECLGDRYGWGGMLNAFDCSSYARTIYRCFGLELPRNTNWQTKVPGHYIDFTNMTDEQKLNCISNMPIGSLIYMNGHVVVYTGMNDSMAYAISATGNVADSAEGSSVGSRYSIILNPLSVKRANGTTWLSNMIGAVTFGTIQNISLDDCVIEIEETDAVYTGEEIKPAVKVTYNGKEIIENKDYKITYSNNINAGDASVIIVGCGDYSGTINKKFSIKKARYEVKSDDYTGQYDGNPHTIKLSGVYEGSSIEYRISDDGEWMSKKPARIKVGSTTVYYRITNQNYETILGSNVITISASNSADNPVETGDGMQIYLFSFIILLSGILFIRFYHIDEA